MRFFTRIKALLFFLSLFAAFLSQAQNVTITQGTVTNLCIGSSPATLSNIVIQENAPGPVLSDDAIGGGNVDVTGTIIFGIDADFQFVAGTGSVSVTGGDVFLLSYSVTTTAVTLNIFAQNATAPGDFVDNITISGLQVRAINTPAQTGLITRTGGTLSVTGLIVGNQVGSATSVANPTPTLSSSDGDNIICAGASVTFTGGGGVNYEFFVDGISVQNGVGTTYATTGLLSGQTVTVRVTNASGCLATSSGITTTVNPNPIASITSSDADNIICTGTSVTFTATPAGASTYNFRVNGISQQLGASNLYTTNALTNGQTVDVIVTSAASCTGTSAGIVMTVNANPTPTLSSSDGDNIICAGASVTFTGGGGVNYEFFVDGISVQNGAGTTYATTGLLSGQTVTVRVTNASGCLATSSGITTTVNPNPIASITSSDADNIICTGTSVTFTATPAGASTYNFRVNGISQQLGASNLYTTNALTNGQTVDVIVTSAASCTGTSAGIVMTVNANPTPTLTSSDGDNIICAGASVTFTGGGGVNYEFFVDGISVQNGAGTTYATTGLLSGQTVTVRVTNASGCLATSSGITTTVNPNPIASITSSDADNIICTGTSVTFTATPAGASTYNFRVNGISQQLGASNLYTTSALTNGQTVDVIVTSAASCTGTSAGIVMTVNANPTPTLSSSDGDNIICAGASVTFTGGGGVNYEFFVDGISVQNGAGTTYATTGLLSGQTVTVRVTNASGCLATSSGITTTVNPNPIASITSSDADNIICTGTSVTFTATPAGASTYNFRVNGISQQLGASNLYTTNALTNGQTVDVIVTSAASCTGTSAGIVMTVNANPTPTLSSSDGDNIICAGASVTFTGGGGVNYEFFVDGISVQNGAGTTYATTGLLSGQTVTVRVTNASGCLATSSGITTTVNPNPIASITSSDADNIICTGTSVTFTATPAGASTYNFRVNGISQQLGASNLYTTSALTNGQTVDVIVTSAASCTGTSAGIVMTVNANPTPTLTSSDGDNIICAGASVTFTGGGGVNYEFFVDGISVQNGAGTTYATTGLLSGQTVTVRVTNASGCLATSSGITTTVNPNPIASITSSDADNIICTGTSVTFTATPAGASTYNFRVNGISQQLGASNLYTTSALTNGQTVDVIVTSAASCTGTSAGIVMTVNANPTPTLSSSDGDNIICAGASVTFTGGGGVNYEFFVDGISVQNGAGTTYATTGLLSGQTVTVRVTNASGCLATSSGITTTVNPNPIASITSSDADNIICTGTSVTFTATPAGASTYNFRVNGISQQLGASNLYTTSALTNGQTVDVIVTSAASCTGTSAGIVMTVNANPTPTLSSSDGDNIICAGASVTFTGGGGVNYEFFVDGISVQNGAGTTYATTGLLSGQTVTVRVTNASGCLATSSGITTTVNPNPIASITSSDADNIICTGTSVTFTATPAGASTYNFRVNGISQQLGASNLYTTSALTNGQTVDVIVTSAASCTGTSAGIVMTVNANPTPTLTSSDGDNIICAGASVTFTGGGGVNYEFFVDGISVQNGAGTTYATTGLLSGRTVTVRVTNASGCLATSSGITTTVNPNPIASITSSDADNIICTGTSVTFTATPAGASTYNFRVNGISQQLGASNLYTTSALTNGQTVDVIVTSAASCTGTSAGIVMTVNANPTPTLSSSDGDNIICAGASVTFTGGGGVNYEFFVDGISVQNGAGTTYATTGLLSGQTVTVRVTNASGCLATSSGITTTVNPNPIASITSSDADNIICTGTSVTFTATPAGASTYNFRVNGISQQLGASNLYTTSALTNGQTVDVIVTSAASCTGTSAGIVMTVNANPTPTLSSSDGDNIICAGASVTFTGGGGVNYEFFVDGISVQNGAGTTYATTGLLSGQTVTVRVTNASGCLATSSGITTTVNPNPIASITSSDADNIICTGTSVTFTATPAGASTYNFRVNGISQQLGASNLYTTSALTNGQTVDVIVTSAASCTGTSAGIVMTVNANPTPTLSSSDGDNIICAGASVTFTGGGGVNYEFFVDGISVQNGAGTTYATTGLLSGQTVTVRVTNASGCLATSSGITTTVNPNPIASITSSDADNIICTGTSVTFTATPAGASTYNFRVNGISQQLGASNLYTTSALTNGQTVDVIVTSAASCTGTSAGIVMTVNANPTPTLTSSDGDNIICAGASVTFTGGGGVNYEFFVDGISVQNGAGTTYATTGLLSGQTVTVRVTNASGCVVTSTGITTVVNPNPIASIVSSDADNIICTGTSVTFTATPAGASTYNFRVNGISQQLGASNLYTTSALTNGQTVDVIVTSAASCTGTSAGIVMTVNANPTPTLSSSDGDNIICAGASVTFTGGGGVNYEFFVDGISVQNGAGTTYATTGLLSGQTVTVRVTNASGCLATSSGIATTVNPNPIAQTISGNNSVCAAEQDVAYSISLIAGRTYSWLVTGGIIDGSSTGNGILVDWGAAGPGTLQVTETITATGCFVTTPIYNVIINNTPTPVISGLATVCANTTGVIYSTPNVIGDIYSWTVIGGSITAGGGTNSITVDWGSAGVGSVTLTQFIIGSGCTVTTNPYLVTINAIPTPSIAGDNTVCANAQDKAYSTPLVGGHTYSWIVTGGTIDGSSTGNSILVDWGTAGLGTIQLTETITASGCLITTPIFSVNINNIPTPVISGSNAVCANDAGVVYSTPNAPGNSYTWSVTGGTVASGAGTNSITVNWGPAGSGSITLTELVPSSSCVTITAPYGVSINPTPSPIITGDNTVCEADQDKVYTSPFNPGNVYSWSVSGGTIDGSSTSSSVTVDWGVAGAGTLSLTETVGGCSTTSPLFNVTVNPNPTPVITGSNSVCRSQTGVTYSTPPAGGRTYSWTVVGGTIDSGAGTNSISVTWTAAGTGSVSVTETISASGCNIATAPFLVSVAPNPVVSAGSDQEICSGFPFNFTSQATPATATDFASLLWTTAGTGVLSNPATLTPSYTPGVGEVGPITFTLTGDGIGACPDAVDQMILNITPLPIVGAGSDSETCAGILFNFSTQLTPASASNYSTITWSHTGAGTLFNPNTLAPTYLPGVGETGLVTFTIQANSTGSCAFVTDGMQLNITPAPTVSAGGDAEVCQGLAYNFATQVPAASASNFLSILWTTSGSGAIAAANTLTPTYTPGVGETGNVTFTLTVNGNGSCGSIQDVMTLSITPSPATNAGSDEEICEGSTFSFSTQATLATASNYNTITWTTSGAGTLFNANTLTPTYFPLVGETGNIIFTLTAIGNGSCISVNDQMTLAITPSPTVTAGSDEETCQGISYNFSTQVTPANATNYASILWSTTGTGVLTNPNTLTPSYAPGVGETGNAIFTLTAIGNGSCASVNDQMTLVITPSPTVTAGSDAETCQGISYNFSTQGTPSNATNYASILWTTLGTGTLTNANTFAPSYAPGVGETGNIIFTLTAIGNGSCISVNDQMTLAITPSPTVTAGSDAETCQGIGYNFSTQVTPANATNYASILWSTTGTGVLTNPNTLTPSYAPGVGETGNVIFTLTAIGNGSCLSVNDQMTLVITPSPTITAGSDSETCQAISYNFSTQGTPASGTNYASILWTHSGTGTIFNANTLTPTYVPGVGETGNVTFTLTALGNGSCTSVNDQMTLMITPSPTIAAGSDAETCQGVTYNFSAQSTLASGTNYASLLWTHSGTGTIFNANTLSPTYAPGVGETGNVTFTLTAMGNVSCASVNDQMTLVITPSPTVTAGSDSETCQGISFNFSSQGTPANASNYASILWTHSGTGTIFNDNTLTPTYLPGIGEAGNVTFTLTATGNGSCLSVNDQMTLSITPSPTVAAGSDAETCQSISYNFSTQTTLANATNNSGVLWTTAGTGILTNANTLTPSYAPGVGETGNVIFTLTATGNGSCTSVNDQMILTITPSPTASAGSDSETCQGVNYNFSTQSTLASASNYSSILWTTIGTGLLSNANTLTPTYSPGIGETGIVTFTLTASGNGSCASVNDQMTLMITPSPTVTAGSDAETCQGVSFNFSTQSTLASAANNSSIVWTTTGTGILTNANTLSPSYAPGAGETGNVTFTLTAMGNGSCISVNDQMTLVITPSPTVTAGSDAETCQGVNYNFGTQSTPSNATNYFTILWTTTGTGTIFNATTFAPTYQPGIGEAGNVTFTLTATGNGSCVSVNDQMTLVITPLPIVSAGSNAETCQGISYNFSTQSTLASASNFSGLVWTHTGTGSLTGSTSLTPTYTPGVGETGTVTFTLTANGNGSCVALNDVMVLTITPSVAISAGSDEEICQGGVFNFVTQSTLASALNYSSLIWTHSGAGTLYNSNTLTPTYFASAGETGTVTFTLTALGNGSCVSLNDPMILTITPAPIAIAGSDDAVCEGTSAFDFATRSTIASSLNGSILWSHNGTGSLSDPTVINPTYTVGAGDVNNTITFILSITSPSAVCAVVQDQFALRVNRAALVTVPSTSVTVCEPQRINLLGSFGGSATSGVWSLITGGGTLSTSSITGLNVTAVYDTVSADVSSVLQFRLTTNDPDGAGPCTSVFVDMDVTVEESAKVFAGNDFAVCEYDDIDLNGSFSGATSSVTWSGGAGGAFGSTSSPITSYDMTPAERAATGLSITFTLTTDNPAGVCSSVSDQVIVTVNDTLNFVTFTGLDPIYQEDDASEFLIGVPNTPAGAGIFTGPGMVAGTNEFIPDNANLGANVITYTYTDPATGCVSSPRKTTIVNPITTIDFDVNITPTVQVPEISGVPQVCATIRPGDVLLKGDPDVLDIDASTLTPPFFEISPDVSPSYIFQKVDGQYYINTKNLPPGNYVVTYTYTNQFEAQTQFSRSITVLSAPKAIIDAGNSCVTSAVFFPESSTIPVNNGAVIDQWFWDFDDGGATSTAQEPSHLYSIDNVYDVVLEVTTNEGCKHDTLKTIIVGPVPGVNFSWSEFCNGNDTKFVDATFPGTIVQYTWEFADGFTVSGPVGGPIPGGTNGGRTFGTYTDPQHRYDFFGQKDVKLTVVTDVGCVKDTTRTVSILSYNIPTPISSYFEDFELSQGSWFSSIANQFGVAPVATDTSWIWGAPTGTEINTGSLSANAWWTGSNPNFAATNSTYFNNENSAVLGPCVNLDNIKRPMMSIDYWSDAEDNFDGAVVQYSIDGGSRWETLGDDGGAGINWYNGRALTGNPGEQTIGQFGWSDRQSGWKNARYNLDQIPMAERNEVIFRVAFASNNDNDVDVTTPTFNGFAFDNVFIGEKQRNVLVEYFTNDGINQTVNDYLNNLYSDKSNIFLTDSADFVKIQYHIANPAADIINQDNPVDPAARSLYYGVSLPPVGIMDGILGNYFGTTFNGDQNKINLIEIDRRTLEDPLFDIQITELPSVTNDSINLSVDFVYTDSIQTLSTPVTFQIGLVQDSILVGTKWMENVLRKFLLGSEGQTVNTVWTPGILPTTLLVKSAIDVPIGVNNQNLWIVAFVQDRNTKRMHQMVLKEISTKTEATIVGVEDPVLSGAQKIEIFPNPASRQLNFTSEYRLMEGYTYSIVDQRGITLQRGELKEDIFTPQQVELDNLANGVYFVIISRGGRALVHRKIVVLNRN